jgi:hypothetical protein
MRAATCLVRVSFPLHGGADTRIVHANREHRVDDPALTPAELARIAAGAPDALLELAAVQRLLVWYYRTPAPDAPPAG